MPTLTQKPSQKVASALFIGLQSYTEAQSAIFYGRDEEIDRLTNLVKGNTLTIVFGKSGTGKTSLLNAGVFPLLRKDYCLPFRIRLEFAESSADLVTQIKNILRSEIDKYGFRAEAYPGEETLWEYFHREPLWNSVTPILIFDQFEEIFTLGRKSDHFGGTELAEFWNELADVIENSIPEKLKDRFLNGKEAIDYSYKFQKVKTVFSFREEFLPEFESITAKIPSIKYSRFRLLPMNGHQAYEVITRTWKSNISAAEARNIVGFFAREDAKTPVYDAMEIEPSLLSQVCSFIDKERRVEGRDKISADFLTKYPKEKILRSVYNEALTESNVAVAGAAINLNAARPVNEFVEDKLITNEGYRTKYALAGKDEKIRPGIEVLKSKYFIREDDGSVELTHDVLAPLIKRDREERRKALALAVAKKKANRRSLFIVLLALVGALLFWYFTAQKAIEKKDEAIRAEQKAYDNKKNLDSLIHQDSAFLKNFRASIDAAKKSLDSLTALQGKVGLTGDSVTLSTLLAQIQNDSIQLAALKKQNEDLINGRSSLDSNLRFHKGQADEFMQKLSTSSNEARRDMANLQRRYFEDSSKLAFLRKTHNDLVKTHNDYIKQVSEIDKDEDYGDVADTSTALYSDTNSLHLNLFYSASKNSTAKLPNNLRIYLIPDNSSNKAIINNAKIYEIRCDETNLDRAKGKKIARFKNGAYSFYDVPPGKYFVKICTYYGGYYTFTKKETGNVSVNWDASPPIR